jgi:putative colanic acid biosynthesis acetyltransferase WcaF
VSGRVDLSAFRSRGFDRGASFVKEGLWVLVSAVLFRALPLTLSPLKRGVLRLFGARIGRAVVIKPDVRITFPWRLSIGDNAWIGEGAWLLNLAAIEIGNDACVSQRAFLCTGSHDYKAASFDLLTGPIILEEGAWIAAGAWVGPGVRVGSHAVLTAQSVATHDLEAFGVFRGNPATLVHRRQVVR